MGGRGTYAAGNNVPYRYKTIGFFDDFKIVVGEAGIHGLPEEAHSSKAYALLNPDGTLKAIRFYGKDHRAVLEIAYQKEPTLSPDKKPVLHYHLMNSKNEFHSDAIPATKEMIKKFLPLFKKEYKHD